VTSPPRTMELRHLRYFVAVAEELHFGRAAERLRIAQPGLSQQIKALERSLGVDLFIRDRRAVELTEAGETLLEHTRQIIELAERAVESTRVAGLTKKGLLKVGTSAVAIFPVAKHVLEEFQDRFPQVQVEIRPGFGPQNIEALTRRVLDLAIVFAPFQSPQGLRYFRLEEAELMVALPRDHHLSSLERIPRSELLKEPLLEGPRSVNPSVTDHIHRSIFGEIEHPRRLEFAEILETNRFQLVADGRGLALTVAPLAAGMRIHGIVFRRIEEPTPSIECGVAWFDTHPSRLVPAFIRVARNIVGSPAA
jgi:DNA-binding transcriptional LysR family regulator